MYPLSFGIVFALIGALAIEKLRRTYRSYAELSIAIIMAGGIALASVLFTWGRGFNMNVHSFLFGSILTLSTVDVWIIALVTVIVTGMIFLMLKELFVVTFDEDAAHVNGLPVNRLNLMLTGPDRSCRQRCDQDRRSPLVSALLTIPVACSLVVAKSFRQTVVFSILVGELAIVGGLFLSGTWNWPPEERLCCS